MKISVNGKTVELGKEISVIELLKQQEVKMPEYVSVQINDEILSREDFETRIVKEKDIVEFLYFMGGGF
jgi:sulfur carrier protein